MHTLAGTGLYDFGARNDAFADARFQHPLGIAWHDGRLLVAGSYNGALRVMDLKAMRVSDLDEGSFVCTDPFCLPAAEPAGVTVDGPERPFMVATNNHRIVECNLKDKTDGTWSGQRGPRQSARRGLWLPLPRERPEIRGFTPLNRRSLRRGKPRWHETTRL